MNQTSTKKTKFKKSFNKSLNRYKHSKLDTGLKLFRPTKSYNIKPDPFPRILFSRLVYGDTFKLTTSSTFTDYSTMHAFRILSLYDPDFTGTGYKYKGYDRYQSIYNRFIVMGVKAVVSFTDPSDDGFVCGVDINQDDPIAGGESQGTLISKALCYQSVLNNTGSQKKVFKFYIKPWTLIKSNIDKRQYITTSTNHGNLASNTNPVNLWFSPWALNLNHTSATINFNIKLYAYVRFFDRISLVQV